MATRSEISEALRWCNRMNWGPWEVVGPISIVAKEQGLDTGDLIVQFVNAAREQVEGGHFILSSAPTEQRQRELPRPEPETDRS